MAIKALKGFVIIIDFKIFHIINISILNVTQNINNIDRINVQIYLQNCNLNKKFHCIKHIFEVNKQILLH